MSYLYVFIDIIVLLSLVYLFMSFICLFICHYICRAQWQELEQREAVAKEAEAE